MVPRSILRRRGLALPLASALLLVVASASVTLGYNGTGAATWARNHAIARQCPALPCLPNDCTNFVSWAMNLGGGYPQHVGNGFEENSANWYATKNGLGLWVNSYAWGYADVLYTYMVGHSPTGWLYGWAWGNSSYSYTGLAIGRLVFYDWTNDGTVDHVSIITGTGKDLNWSSTQIGDLISQHDKDRLNTWWTGYPYNQNRNITRIRLVGIG